ncbi:DUF3486 family protein [Psychrobacter sp. I-STPA10]|uniref:DUF3486 family protein n=1 Tax=Psychrobacter sp. I-STPA10 TaxID=2585769 RepID=UPI001E2AC8EA|nr:DUF3486 family protein [Psychrobacter sp. I-STPA10]
MAKSSIKTLPPLLLEQLQDWLRDPRITQIEATERLNELLEEIGEPPRSKSAVNRYAVQMNEVGARIQQSREMAEMWVGRFGNAPQGKVGQLLNEVIRNLAFNTAINLSDGDGIVEPKMLKELAMAVEKLENAATINEKRQREIEKAILAKAAKETEKAIVEAGLSADTANEIKQKILGIA